MNFVLGINHTVFYVEPEGFEGVRRIAGTVAKDIQAVTGQLPEVTDRLTENGQVILCATLGRSPMADRLLARGVLDGERLRGRREVYQIALTEIGGNPALVICGSDKRGTIYGMFALSEYIGVSPLCFFGDAEPLQRDCVPVGRDIETVSKEPSVRYRGFFINDEWPCFGTWATTHYGDVNARCYDKIFEFLLRMKGNYLWPAMWASSFPLDGPGSANEELADLYGVVMGYSHHEPCLRASEEWDKVRGEGSRYGNEWNFYTNEQGLLNYWEDALIRSGGYENIITIGMRGERDTSMLGEDSTLEENIALLKRIITKQRELIRRHGKKDAPQLLALYKEVERYFHGDESTEGLRSWKELDDVLFLLCEDNHNHLRTVPPKDMRNHPGGWGMYYHFDYHGGPVSYEWVDSTPLSVTWEQMTQAWEYGIRDLWIVNVGDLKFHEVPLTYFLALAYDYDKWGSANPHSAKEYTALWAKSTFPGVPEQLQAQIGDVLRDYIHLNSLRRPEALNEGIYHPCHYGEADRMLAIAENLESRSSAVYEALAPKQRDAYYSMVHYPAMASANLVKMHLYAAKNAHYAAQGKPVANRYGKLTEDCIARDLALAEEFGAFREGKWDGMQLASHIGFTRWNDDDCRYPVIRKVTPLRKAFMKVSRADREALATKIYGGPMVIEVPDFCDAGCDTVTLEIANGGSVPFSFRIEAERELPRWLTVEPDSGTVTEQTQVTLRCDRSRLPKECQTCTLHVTDGDAVVALRVSGRAVPTDALMPMTFLERNGVISMLAEHYSAKQDAPGAAFGRLEDYGKYGSGMKVFPSTAEFEEGELCPKLTYSFLIGEEGDYQVEILTAPNNPVQIGSPVKLLVETAGQKQVLELLPPDFRAGENSDPRWCQGVLDQIHSAKTGLHFPAGVQTLTLGAMSPGVVIEKILIYRDNPLPSYLGPRESWFRR